MPPPPKPIGGTVPKPGQKRNRQQQQQHQILDAESKPLKSDGKFLINTYVQYILVTDQVPEIMGLRPD